MALMTSNNPILQRLEQARDAHFTYDVEAGTWCLSGPYRAGTYDEAGPYWETDDVPAATLEQAEEQAISYLELAHEHEVEGLSSDDDD